MNLSEKLSMFWYIFFPILQCTLNLPGSETKGKLIGQVFLKLLSPNDVLIQMHSKACF